MSVTIKNVDLNLFKILNKVKRTKDELKVGFFDQENAQKAYHNEYGDIDNGGFTPARPFLDMTVEDNKDDWAIKLAKLLKQNDYNSNKSFNLLGEIVKNDVQKTIQEGNFEPNAPSTIARKGKDTPLLDTHDMFNSVTYRVDKKE